MINNKAYENTMQPVVVKKMMRKKFSVIFLTLLFIVVGTILSITVGAANIGLQTIFQSITAYNPTDVQHYTIIEMRLPRAVAAALIGACFAAAGTIMQAMTRNPLASPGTLGVSAGSSFAIIVAFAFFPSLSYSHFILFSLLGAAITTVFVYFVGTITSVSLTGHVSHVKLALVGAATGAFLGAFGKGIELYLGIQQSVLYWYSAGVAGVKWSEVLLLLPWAIAGLVLAIILSRNLTMLALGDETAANLGSKVKRIKAFCAITVFILTGAAVAISGPIGFIGLIIPHLTRFFVGIDYRWVVPSSALLGACFMLTADALSRMVNPPYETPAGVITSLIGVPFFLYLARKEGKISI
ncbi:FecCD family ABC transporter permease [Paenibacillus sp. sgz302251]|uniref:FecCD family ABC transporter permease n=1 Tax=Paenibacillus sp. sgz302251 TaxID=3414493 RepID=UPI003C7A96FF